MGASSVPSRRRRALRFGVALGLLSAAVACGGDGEGATGGGAQEGEQGEQGTPQSGGTLQVAFPIALTSGDPIKSTSAMDLSIYFTLYDGLTRFDPATGEAVPALATSWEYTDERTLVMTLQEGVTFHDGEPFNADAVKYNVERMRDTEGSATSTDVASIESVEVLDEYEVQFNLSAPNTALPLIFSDRAGLMVSPKAAEEMGEDFALHPVGTGPFMLSAIEPGVSLEVVRNPDYWVEGVPYLDGIDFTYLTESSAAVNAVMSGDADLTFRVSPSEMQRVENVDNVVVTSSPSIEFYRFYFNYDREPFDDVRVRQAMNYAVNREELVSAASFGVGAPIWQAMPKGHWAYDEGLEDFYPYDPERARELLAEAGYPDGFSFKVTTFAVEDYIRRAEILQEQWADVGIDAEIVPLEFSAAVDAAFTAQSVDAATFTIGGRADPGQLFNLIHGKDAFFNPAKYEDPEVERLIAEGFAAEGLEERAAIYRELAARILDQALDIPMTEFTNISVRGRAVQGYEETIFGRPSYTDVWLSE